MSFSNSKCFTKLVCNFNKYVCELIIKKIEGDIYYGSFISIDSNSEEYKTICKDIVETYNNGNCEFDVINDSCNVEARKYITITDLFYNEDVNKIFVSLTVNNVSEVMKRYGLYDDFKVQANCTQFKSESKSLPENYFTIALYNAKKDENGMVINIVKE